MTASESSEFYLKERGIFLADFWNAGNKDLTVWIEPRREVESGRWYQAHWLFEGCQRYADAQWEKLLWERIIKQFLADEKLNADKTP